eukprot:gene5711-6411_t
MNSDKDIRSRSITRIDMTSRNEIAFHNHNFDLGILLQHYSGLCISIRNATNRLDLGADCTERFQWTKYHSIMHVRTGLCVTPETNNDNAKLYLKNNCKHASAVFRFTANMSLQHVKSGKCLHPYWGCPVPAKGEDIVLHAACDEPRLQFEPITENTECRAIYPYCNAVANRPASASPNCSTVELIQGLEWHWVYIIIVVGSSIVIVQGAVIVCIYSKMMKSNKRQQQQQQYPTFGSGTKGNHSVSCAESEGVRMLGITSAMSDEAQASLRFSEYSDFSSVSDDQETSQLDENEVAEAGTESQERRAYMNIDYNKNARKKPKLSQQPHQQGGSRKQDDSSSKRTSKLAIDFSRMRNVFKVRKSYTLNDLELLKRISIERHEYEEPISPSSLNSSNTGDSSSSRAQPRQSAATKRTVNGPNNIANSKKNEYIEPDTSNAKKIRTRSSSVPAKMAPPEHYLKPVCVGRERGYSAGNKFRKTSAAAYVNIEPVSPDRTEKNLYDMPELTQIKEQEDTTEHQQNNHVYLKILED